MRACVITLAAVIATLIVAATPACGGGNDWGVDGACMGGSGCGEPCQQANPVGVGMACTAGGGQCGRNMAPFLFCTADYEAGAWPYCTGPCGSDADCGDGAYCSGSGH